jgi:hypothetical protein
MTDNADTNISRSYIECLDQYRSLLTLIGHESSRAVKLRESELTNALEEYGRLRTWGEETRAALPSNARGSLDDTLRKEVDLKNVVTRTLARLQRQVQVGKYGAVYIHQA